MARSVEMPALHGRAHELELLDASIERAASGTVQTTLIEGEAGIGKTRILEAALDHARARGFRVFAGRADELERARPFGPIAEALGCDPEADHPLRAEIARLLAGEAREGHGPLEPTREPGLQFRVVDAAVDLVEDLALAAPVALAIEDAHWADPSTLLTIRSLARRLQFVPVALLVTMRPLPRSPELERLVNVLTEDHAQLLTLGPLDEAAVGDLVADLVAAEPGGSLRDEVASASGNPLFVTELVKALEEEGAIELVDDRAELREASLPPSLRLTILRRLSFLDAIALDLLRVASVLGSTFSLRDVAIVLDTPTTELLQPLRDAIRAGVIEEREARLAFRHDLIREAVYEDLPEDVRGALHLDTARRLAAAGAPATRVAEQFALGAQPGDTQAVASLHDAARDAARRAPSIAVDLLERALELADEPERRESVVADLVPTLVWAGQPRRAETRAREALAAGVAPELNATLRLGLVQALFAQGNFRDLISEVELALGDAALTPDLRSQLLAEAANALAFVGDLDAVERAAQEAIAVGKPVKSEGVDLALLVLSDAARDTGHVHESLEFAQRAIEHARTRGAERARVRPEIFLAMALNGLDRFDEAHDALDAGRRADERVGDVINLPIYHYEAASLLLYGGRWDDAVAQAEAGLALAEEVGLGLVVQWPYQVLALVAVHRGEFDVAARLVAEADAAPGPRAHDGSAPLPLARSRSVLDEARGNVSAARAVLESAWERNERRGHIGHRRLVAADLARLALAEGDRERAVQVAADMESAAALARLPSVDGAAFRCRGLVDDDADLLLRAVDAFRSGPRIFDRALACEDAALAVARAGALADATALFEEALDVYDQLGARHDEARARASMRELGIRRKRRGARKRPESGWESLTPSELDVVRLAAEGLTNPEIGTRLFISRRTVQTHLAHAFRKLDLSSRVELAAKYAGR